MNVSPENSGTVAANVGAPMNTYPAILEVHQGEYITLQARESPGYLFSHWSGAVEDDAKTTAFTYNFSRSTEITANFRAIGSTAVSRLYFPHVASQQVGDSSGLMWETEICLINAGEEAVTGTLKAYAYQNNRWGVSNLREITLAARGRWGRIVGGGEFENPSQIRYMVFESQSDRVVGYTKFYVPGRYRAALPAVREVNASDIYVPHIASDAVWWTGISLVNTTPWAKELTITFDNGTTGTIPLGAREHKGLDIATAFFGGVPQPDVHSAVIANAEGVIGLELFTDLDPAWGPQMEGILLTDRTAATLYYPDVKNDGWWTGVAAYNPTPSPNQTTIVPFDSQGSALTPSTVTLEGKETYIGAVWRDLDLDLPADTAWFRIDAQQPLSGFQLFGRDDGSLLASYAAGGGTGTPAGIFPKIEQEGSTDIVMVNPGEGTAFVNLTAYNDSGAPVAGPVALVVNKHAKVSKPAADLFPQSISGATYIAYAANRDIVGFQFNGSADKTMRDGLPALD